MRITPVGKSTTFDPMIKLVSSRMKKTEKKSGTQKKASASPGHNGAEIKESIAKLDNLVSSLINQELVIARALEPTQLRTFGFTDPHSLSVMSSFKKLVETLPQIKSSINKIESTPVEELDVIDDVHAFKVIKDLDKYSVSLNGLENSSETAAKLEENVRYLLDSSVEDVTQANALAEDLENIESKSYLDKLSEYNGVLKDLGPSIITASLAAVRALKDLGYVVSFKKSDIIEDNSEAKAAEKDEDTMKKEAGIKSFAALDDKTKEMLKKYWKIIYPSEYIDAQFKNY